MSDCQHSGIESFSVVKYDWIKKHSSFVSLLKMISLHESQPIKQENCVLSPKSIRVFLQTDGEMFCKALVQLDYPISILNSLFKSKKVIYTKNGRVLNPYITFRENRIKNHNKILVIHEDPKQKVTEMSRNKWTIDITNLRMNIDQQIVAFNLETEYGRIRDLKITRAIFRLAPTYHSCLEQHMKMCDNDSFPTVIASPPTELSNEPLPIWWKD